jgi:hypothetical protein
MDFFLNQVADVGTRITWSDKRFRRFLFEIRDLMDFKGEINNSWGMYSLYIHSNGRTIKEFVERLNQYTVNIDSTDRDINLYPNPFKFNIIFNSDKYSNKPVIQKKFKDIKYLKLETITLPDEYSIKKEALTINPDIANLRTYFNTHYSDIKLNTIYTVPMSLPPIYYIPVSIFIDNTDWIINYIINDNPDTLNGDSSIVYEMNQSTLYNKYYIDTTKKISNDRYFYIYVPEIKSQNYTTSSDNVTFIVKCTGTNNYTLLNNIYPTFMFYKDSSLEKTNKYTVTVTDRYGSPYKVNNMDYNANIEDCNCQNEINYSCRCSYIRNPYYVKLQVSLQFKFGTFEDDLYKELLNLHPRQG